MNLIVPIFRLPLEESVIVDYMLSNFYTPLRRFRFIPLLHAKKTSSIPFFSAIVYLSQGLASILNYFEHSFHAFEKNGVQRIFFLLLFPTLFIITKCNIKKFGTMR